MARRRTDSAEPLRKSRPATTMEAREAQLIALAYDRAEQRLRDGTASGQEITALIKAGSAKTRYEMEKLKNETEKLKAQKEVLEASKRTDEMYDKAIAAMRTYMGIAEEVDGDPYILGVD